MDLSVSRSGIIALYNRFLSLATHRDKATNEYFLTEVDFQNIADLQQNPLGQRIIDAFFADAKNEGRGRIAAILKSGEVRKLEDDCVHRTIMGPFGPKSVTAVTKVRRH
ncbi:hypothetical protein DICVIV_00925 [Dictyocaulus viviparus]|uniref:Uncharacterized protein n=1 Tax=Dictyocaulus viviparus TaxID=29172 RepID=A0A0D8YA69_DICVI|nr:hypothetical protein DICVIV_00925 [Dictyocaulus viviparus]